MPTEVELPFSRLIAGSIIFFKAAYHPRRGKIQARQVFFFFFLALSPFCNLKEN